MLEIALATGVLAIIGAGIRWTYNYEKRAWNDGICAENGQPWVRYDCDSHGCRGYKAGTGSNPPGVWISYGVDKNYNHFAMQMGVPPYESNN